jgi:hypothetical protein
MSSLSGIGKEGELEGLDPNQTFYLVCQAAFTDGTIAPVDDAVVVTADKEMALRRAGQEAERWGGTWIVYEATPIHKIDRPERDPDAT